MKLLIAIHASHSQPEAMQAQRETWLQDLHGADYKFFLGYPEVSDQDVVLVEHSDGPIWEREVGGRRTSIPNIKTEAIAKYALANDYDFVFKCDDDTYVQTEQLLASGFEEHDYVGCMDRHYTRALGFYQWAQGGAGYWLSRRSIEIIAKHGLRAPVLPEDFAVGNVLATHGVHAHHDGRYVPELPAELDNSSFSSGLTVRRFVTHGEWITVHKVSPEWMQHLHQRLAS